MNSTANINSAFKELGSNLTAARIGRMNFDKILGLISTSKMDYVAGFDVNIIPWASNMRMSNGIHTHHIEGTGTGVYAGFDPDPTLFQGNYNNLTSVYIDFYIIK
ncbi:MAG: hypothetical protein JXA68_11255 [Ignavibacteriales bacterium]|nr:hypothetical protein [Ignavibacteriales bacterium]